MRFVMHGRTTFVIAHRISTVKQADLVLVIEDGRITQIGTHDQLMEQTGITARSPPRNCTGRTTRPTKPRKLSHMKRLQSPEADRAPVAIEAESTLD